MKTPIIQAGADGEFRPRNLKADPGGTSAQAAAPSFSEVLAARPRPGPPDAAPGRFAAAPSIRPARPPAFAGGAGRPAPEPALPERDAAAHARPGKHATEYDPGPEPAASDPTLAWPGPVPVPPARPDAFPQAQAGGDRVQPSGADLEPGSAAAPDARLGGRGADFASPGKDDPRSRAATQRADAADAPRRQPAPAPGVRAARAEISGRPGPERAQSRPAATAPGNALEDRRASVPGRPPSADFIVDRDGARPAGFEPHFDAPANAVAAAGGGLLAALHVPPGAPASPAAAPGAWLAVTTPLPSPHWSGDFGRQFLALARMTASGRTQAADLRLDPPDLGPLRVSITISDGMAHAQFVSPHAAVRHAVEHALPALQQALEQAGISLGQTSVNDQGAPGEALDHSLASRRGSAAGAAAAPVESGADANLAAAPRARTSATMIDTFA